MKRFFVTMTVVVIALALLAIAVINKVEKQVAILQAHEAAKLDIENGTEAQE